MLGPGSCGAGGLAETGKLNSPRGSESPLKETHYDVARVEFWQENVDNEILAC